jgi:Gas vesicle synthesis protein GvpL/GvpF
MSLRVYGVVMHDGQGPLNLLPGLQLQPLRELAAVAEEGDYSTREIEDEDIQRHYRIVENLFGQDAVLPTPVGTVFRSTEVLQRWMDLHYVALSDALAWVEDRVAARVHVTRAETNRGDRDTSADIPAIAAEVTRSLRRRTVASVPLRTEDDRAIVQSAGYLVEAELWNEFADAIADEQDRHPLLRIALTGPWPPYDFVRLQFGS